MLLANLSKQMSKKVFLFLSNGFEGYEAGVFTDVVGWSSELGRTDQKPCSSG